MVTTTPAQANIACIFSLPPRWCHASFLPLGLTFQRLVSRDWKTQLKSPGSERPWLKSWYQNSSLTCLCFPLAASQWISLFFGLCEWLPPPLALQPLSISVPAKGIRRGLRKSYRRTITGNWHNRWEVWKNYVRRRWSFAYCQFWNTKRMEGFGEVNKQPKRVHIKSSLKYR